MHRFNHLSTHLDRHSRAVKAKWPQASFAFKSLIAHRKFALGKGESVAQMKLTVHVRIREAREELVI